jgi:transcriptional antiterminator RfaH
MPRGCVESPTDDEKRTSRWAEPSPAKHETFELIVAWYVVETKRYREGLVRASLVRHGIGCYLPRVVQWPRPAVGGDVEPMFPGYVFVQATLPRDYPSIVWSPGVKAFVTFGDAPPALDASIIDYLRSREGPDGIIPCGDGDRQRSALRIVNGPLRGFDAVLLRRCSARDRIRVLVEILQRETQVDLPEKWVRRR